MNFYNEWDAYSAHWLKNLIKEGHIPKGVVDERDIKDIEPDELIRYRQCHFFAGIAGWSYALELANWGDREVWTGSCPCQPFSHAGKGTGASDERNLWGVWLSLIKVAKPNTIFGEQVASAVGKKYQWLDAVSNDLENEGYRIGAGILPACSVQAPHIRQRLWFVADTHDNRRNESFSKISGEESKWNDGDSLVTTDRHIADPKHNGRNRPRSDTSLEESNESEIGIPVGDDIACANANDVADSSNDGRYEGRSNKESRRTQPSCKEGRLFESEGISSYTTDRHMADSQNHGRRRRSTNVERKRSENLKNESEFDLRSESSRQGKVSGNNMADTNEQGLQGGLQERSVSERQISDKRIGLSGDEQFFRDESGRFNKTRGKHWEGIVWVYCKDKKTRPIKPGVQPLAYGVSARVGKLRSIGNAIVPQVAAEIIKAYMEEKNYE